MRAVIDARTILARLRDGETLREAEIFWFAEGLATGEVTDAQAGAFAMAVCARGLGPKGRVQLTAAMRESGRVLTWHLDGPVLDKHSTGGVGDKTSLILAPIAAACGVTVPMVSGRGLGHTGGTLDKLESIPGFRIDLDLVAYRRIARECGLVLIGQTAEIAPADRVLYALRDATATVESIPLITASILSKKLAEGIDALVLDVKSGDGAFMARREDARALAESMASIGRAMGKPVRAILTSMDAPLGRMVGNALEVRECVECLRGEGPEDLMEVSLELAAEMLVLGGVASNRADALARCRGSIADGSALDRFRRVVVAQGGDPRVCDDPLGVLPRATRLETVRAERAGFIQEFKAWPVGQASMLLGAGRATAEDAIDPAAGIVLVKTVGDRVAAGDVIAELHFNPPHAAAVPAASDLVAGAVSIGPEAVTRPSLILERLE